MRQAIEQQLAAMVTSSQRKYKLGAAPVYEPMPPRTTVNFEAVGRVLSMLGKEKRLLESRELVAAVQEGAGCLPSGREFLG